MIHPGRVGALPLISAASSKTVVDRRRILRIGDVRGRGFQTEAKVRTQKFSAIPLQQRSGSDEWVNRETSWLRIQFISIWKPGNPSSEHFFGIDADRAAFQQRCCKARRYSPDQSPYARYRCQTELTVCEYAGRNK